MSTSSSQISEKLDQFGFRVKKIRMEFKGLLSKTRASLNERQIKVSDLKVHVAEHCQLESVYIKDENLSGQELTNKLEEVCSVGDIFFLLIPFWSFLDYEILEGIINEFGDSRHIDKKNMDDYKHSLERFLSSWKIEPCIVNQHCDSCNDSRIQLHLKLDTDSMSCYRYIKNTIASIFKLELYELCLHSIKCGCLEIVLLLPNFPRLLSMTLNAQEEIEKISPRVLQYSIGNLSFSPVSFVMHALPHDFLYYDSYSNSN